MPVFIQPTYGEQARALPSMSTLRLNVVNMATIPAYNVNRSSRFNDAEAHQRTPYTRRSQVRGSRVSTSIIALHLQRCTCCLSITRLCMLGIAVDFSKRPEHERCTPSMEPPRSSQGLQRTGRQRPRSHDNGAYTTYQPTPDTVTLRK